jgi:hypothetical protein
MLKWVVPIAAALWLWLLRGFVPLRTLLVLSFFGPLLLAGGLGIVRVMGPRLLKTTWCAGAFLVGLAMIAGSLATLAPAAPADLLVRTSAGWDVLGRRMARLAAASSAGDVALVRRLALRGVGDAESLDPIGLSVVHRGTDAGLLAALIDAGLAVDARDADGRTLLMHARRPEIARALLAAGADVDAQDRAGVTVGDSLPEELRAIVEAHAGRPLRGRADEGNSPGGSTEWLIVTGDTSAPLANSTVVVDPPRIPQGETATITATLSNASAEDRRVDVAATLNGATLFVSASHGGSIEPPARPAISRRIRWPVLSLPAYSQGRLELQVVTRSHVRGDELGVDWLVRTLPGRDEETLEVEVPLGEVEPAAVAGDRSAIYAAGGAVVVAGLWILMRRVRRAGTGRMAGVATAGSIVAGGLGVVLGLVLAVMLWSIVEPWVRFHPADCTILDLRVRMVAGRSSSISQTETRPGFAPLAAVRIEHANAPVITSGFDVGFPGGSVHDLRAFAVGSRVPCWVDPARATRFTLVRAPGLSSWLAIGSITLLSLLLSAISRGLRGEDRPSGRRRAS